MTRLEFAQSMARLAAAYREDIGEATLEVYYDVLGRWRAADLDTAVLALIRRSVWFPKVAELETELEHLAQVKRLALPRGEPVALQCARCRAVLSFVDGEWGGHFCEPEQWVIPTVFKLRDKGPQP